jgi:hypothetical protein
MCNCLDACGSGAAGKKFLLALLFLHESFMSVLVSLKLIQCNLVGFSTTGL